MQVKIRLQRLGSKKRPFYRIVAATSIKKREGKFLEIVGLYHPIMPEGSQVRLDEEKIKAWLDKGAEPTDTVRDLLSKKGLWKAHGEAKEARRVNVIKKRNVRRSAKKAAGKSTPAVASATQGA